MRISGGYEFSANPQSVWDHLLDPNVISSCMPGCENFEEVEPDKFEAMLAVGVSAVKGRYSGTIQIEEKRPIDSYRMTVQGKGRPGIIDATGIITLVPNGPITTVSFEGDATAAGLLGRIGSRLITATAAMLINQFMKCIEGQLNGKIDSINK